jgi:bisphosphoglycerate-independent phosphoglycerate mutase (AlkP superfamily)
LSLVRPQGIISDIAPTILKILDIKKPDEMSGISLL